MIVTVYLLCGRGCRMGAPYGGVFYIMIYNCTQGWVWGHAPPGKF